MNTNFEIENYLIDNHSLFGDYNELENRATIAMLKILNYAGEPLLSNLIAYFDEILPLSQIQVATQVPFSLIQTNKSLGSAVADGMITFCSPYTIMFECKVKPFNVNLAHNLDQLGKYICVSGKPGIANYLIYVTPDEVKPNAMGDNVFWINWKDLLDLFEKYVQENEDDDILSFLVCEFRNFLSLINVLNTNPRKAKGAVTIEPLIKKKLISINDFEFDAEAESEQEVLVVGGKWGESIALCFDIYVCQYKRYFKKTKYLSFYYNNRIKYLFEILGDPKDIDDLHQEGVVKEYFEYDKAYDLSNDKQCKLFKLRLVKEFEGDGIINDCKDKNGKKCAYVQRNRYTTIEKILAAHTTSEL